MTTLEITSSQEKTLQSIRETISIFSDWKEDAKMIIKRGKPTTLMVAFETDNGIYQYQINKTGGVIRMDKTSGLGGLHLSSFNLKNTKS